MEYFVLIIVHLLALEMYIQYNRILAGSRKLEGTKFYKYNGVYTFFLPLHDLLATFIY